MLLKTKTIIDNLAKVIKPSNLGIFNMLKQCFEPGDRVSIDNRRLHPLPFSWSQCGPPRGETWSIILHCARSLTEASRCYYYCVTTPHNYPTAQDNTSRTCFSFPFNTAWQVSYRISHLYFQNYVFGWDTRFPKYRSPQNMFVIN